jgi:L-glyceraldehyde 3-phosphate reductase
MAQHNSLSQSVLTPEMLQYLKQLNAIAMQHHESLAEMALSWILAQKGVTSVLVGASSTGQLENNLKCIQAPSFENCVIPKFQAKASEKK